MWECGAVELKQIADKEVSCDHEASVSTRTDCRSPLKHQYIRTSNPQIHNSHLKKKGQLFKDKMGDGVSKRKTNFALGETRARCDTREEPAIVRGATFSLSLALSALPAEMAGPFERRLFLCAILLSMGD